MIRCAARPARWHCHCRPARAPRRRRRACADLCQPLSARSPVQPRRHRLDGRTSTRPAAGGSASGPTGRARCSARDMSMAEIRHGLADIGLITPIYARGGAHMLRAQSGFYGGVARPRRSGARSTIAWRTQFPEFGARDSRGLHVLAVQGGNFPGVLTRTRPVRTLADFKGLRLRAQSDANDVLRELGRRSGQHADGRGLFGAGQRRDRRRGRAGRHDQEPCTSPRSRTISPRSGSAAGPIRRGRCRMPPGARLPPDLQALVAHAKPVWEAALTREITQRRTRPGWTMPRGHGVEMIRMPPAEQQRFDALYNRLALGQARAARRCRARRPAGVSTRRSA